MLKRPCKVKDLAEILSGVITRIRCGKPLPYFTTNNMVLEFDRKKNAVYLGKQPLGSLNDIREWLPVYRKKGEAQIYRNVVLKLEKGKLYIINPLALRRKKRLIIADTVEAVMFGFELERLIEAQEG